MPDKKEFLKEWERKMPLYRQIEQIAVKKIEHVIQDNEFFVMEVAHRLKSARSLGGKVDRYIDRFQSLSDFTDLIGIRIIVYFDEDIEPIAAAVLKEFEVCEIRDKRQYKNVREFGYNSYHCICSLKPDGTLPAECFDVRFEIQIRTVLQHAWAEIEHDLGYKSDFGVSSPIRREFSRVAGLLEIADNQFSNLRRNAIRYTNMIRTSIEEDHADDLEISVVALNEFIKHGNYIRDYFMDLEKNHGIDIETVDISNNIEQVMWLNVKTLGDLKNLFERSREYVECTLDDLKNTYELDIFSSDAIFRMVMEAELIRNRYSKTQLINFYSLGYSDPDKAERRAERLVKKTEVLR